MTEVWRDATAPLGERVADLVARMTVEEKIGQMLQLDARDDLDERVRARIAVSAVR